MKLLLEEHLAPTLIARCAELDIVAQSVVYLYLGGTDDQLIWRYAFEHDDAIGDR